MSIFELLVVLVVALLVIKPEDIPVIIKKIKKIRSFWVDSKKELLSNLDNITDLNLDKKENTDNIEDQLERINFYLERIHSLGKEYSGDYSLESVKDYYRKLMNQKISIESNKKDKK